MERAERIGDALVLGTSMTLEENVGLCELYRKAAAKAGREPRIVLIRDA